MLAPRWSQLKIGPVLRFERDARTYVRQFRARPDLEVTGLRRLLLEIRGPEIAEPQGFGDRLDGTRGVVTFRGERAFFENLTTHREYIDGALRARCALGITRLLGERTTAFDVVVHVRRGDFRVASGTAEFMSDGALRTPESWFETVLSTVQRIHPASRIGLFTDAAPKDLPVLSRMPGVTFATTGWALADILLLSRSRLLIASGGSSFSAWAAFLGKPRIIVIEGQSFRWFKLPQPDEGRELVLPLTGIDDATLASFLEAVE